MKSVLKTLCFAALLGGSLAALPACSDFDEEYPFGTQALVTVKQDAQARCYLQLDEKTTLYPVNLPQYPFKIREARALVMYEALAETDATYGQHVQIHALDSILTKEAVPHLGEEEDLQAYGNNSIELFDDWTTLVEDGYLNLCFAAYWGYTGNAHSLDLVYGANPEDPYEVHLHHNAHGDIGLDQRQGLVAFSLRNLPDTQGQTVDLKLVWQSGSGEKHVTFKYRTRPDQPAL